MFSQRRLCQLAPGMVALQSPRQQADGVALQASDQRALSTGHFVGLEVGTHSVGSFPAARGPILIISTSAGSLQRLRTPHLPESHPEGFWPWLELEQVRGWRFT